MDGEGQEAQDFYFMGKAIEFAVSAATIGEVPVGAVLVNRNDDILAGAGNNCIQANDPTGHAEIHTLRAAADKLKNYRLPETTMYVTLEPCSMCAGALVLARIDRLVFACHDPKTGACGSLYNIAQDDRIITPDHPLRAYLVGKLLKNSQRLVNFWRIGVYLPWIVHQSKKEIVVQAHPIQLLQMGQKWFGVTGPEYYRVYIFGR